MKQKSPWTWIPTLYFAEGLPNVAVVSLSVVLYTNLGLSNTQIALYTGWIYLPWVIKPVWSPFVDLFRTKRWWIIATQLLMAMLLAGIAFCIPTSFFVQATLAFFWLLAFASATHDIAADGFYLLGLNKDEQSFFVGIRSTFYKIAMIVGTGVLVYLAGILAKRTENFAYAWSVIFFILAGLFIVFFVYHRLVLPYSATDQPTSDVSSSDVWKAFGLTFQRFFTKKHVGIALFFMLTYRFAEAQLLKLIPPFLLDTVAQGGLGLSTEEFGLIYGTVGTIGLMTGGIVGGIVVAKGGLRQWLYPMLLSMLLTCLAFLYLAYFQPDNRWLIAGCVAIEQFGYGFGFTAYMLFLMQFSEGKHQTAHYAICTGFMALGMMLPGMAAGWIQEQLGYRLFFVWVMACSVVPVVATGWVKRKIIE